LSVAVCPTHWLALFWLCEGDVADRVGSRFKQLARLIGRGGSIVRR
jgi:hypothetical protein